MEDNNEELKDEIARAKKILNKSKQENDNNQVTRAFALVTQLGIQMACCVVIGVLLGIFLDRLFGTAPVLIIIFSILGSVASIKVIFDIAKDWKD